MKLLAAGRQLRQLVFLQVQKVTLGTGAVARRPGPSFRALLFGCGAGAVLGQTAIVFL